MIFLKLLNRFVISPMRAERLLTVLSVLGVALGVGLFMGVNVASNRAVKAFETNIKGLNPVFNYEVVDKSGIDFQEDVYKTVRKLDSQCLPVLATSAFVPIVGQTVEINGIYGIKALGFIRSSSKGEFAAEDFFKTLNGVLISKRFANAHQLKYGNRLLVYVYSSAYYVKIVGILETSVLPENMVLMDLGNFQDFFGREGFLTRIDVAAGDKEAESISRGLPAGLAIEKKQTIIQNQASLVNAFKFNLRFVTFLAVLVGVYLLSNTVFISVVKRRREIGILRGLGMEQRTVVALFSAQGVLLGSAGSLLGILFGQLCAWLSLQAVEKTITQFYGSVSVSDSLMNWSDAIETVILGLVISFLASFLPALESANVKPNESLREGTFEQSYRGRQWIFSAIGIFSGLAGGVFVYIDYRQTPFSFPWLSYAGIVMFILGCTLIAPVYLGASLNVLKTPLHKLFKVITRMAIGDMKGIRYRFSLALMSVAISSALIIAVIASVHSLKTSFIDWINTYIAADVYIKPASCTSNFCLYSLPDAVVQTIEHSPLVSAVGRYRALQIDFHGTKIVAGFGNSGLLWKHRASVSTEERARLQRLGQYREVAISDYLKVKYGLKKGDTIELRTPKGNIAFTVNNTSISYSTMSGFLYMDRKWLKEYWGLDDATQLSVYLVNRGETREFVQDIEKKLKARYALNITDNNEFRRAILKVFDRSFAITDAIELIGIVISLIGVVNALLILVLEKKREISILRYLGATWRHIRQMTVLSAGIVGSTGIVLGVIMGSAISIVITHVINRISFGWEVSLQFPFFPLALLMALLFSITVAAGLVPSYIAKRIDPKAFISYE